MKRILSLLIVGMLCLIGRAIPADPTPVKVTQPDGTTLTVVLHGDEFFHFSSTLDGYTVVKNADGYYTFAQLDGNRIVPSNRIARDEAARTAADRTFLATVPKGLTSATAVQSGNTMKSKRNAAMRRVGADGLMDYERFRGLIILINYTDKKFSMNNPNSFYTDMVNTPNYTGYTMNGRRVPMTGSVRDYFYDNSAHIFDPVFDVVGPVDVNYTCTTPGGTSNADQVFYAALDAADELVDFSDYDIDGDGYVDMVFFLVAGFSANYSGNDENYLWPHMYYLYWAPPHDGVYFDLYASSTEIAGWERQWYDVNGIGTFCHEFGHVLGLPDLYDTDYSGSGGESRNPGEWSVMAGGSGSNFGRNPVGYSLYERYALGFTQPEVLDQIGEHTLTALDVSNHGFRLNTPNAKEFFLIENRQPGKWDRYLPGSGMLVARVDSTDERVWWMNDVNANPNHMYYELLRASYKGADTNYDPFPGADNVTSLTNFTKPGLMTWDRQFNDFAITDIAENNGHISFMLDEEKSILHITEDFENMPVTSEQGVEGVFTKWYFNKSAVESPGEGKCNGERAIGMKRPSEVSTGYISYRPYMVSFTVYNPTKTEAKVKMSYSQKVGNEWSAWFAPAEGTLTVEQGKRNSATVNLPIDCPIKIKFNQTSGHATSKIYLDDIKLSYQEEWGPEIVVGDVNLDGEINIADVNSVIDIILTPQGDLLPEADVNEDGEINIADVNMIIDMILTQ